MSDCSTPRQGTRKSSATRIEDIIHEMSVGDLLELLNDIQIKLIESQET